MVDLGPSASVLLVEDSVGQRNQYVKMLTKARFVVTAVEDATAALTHLRSPTPPAVVLVDWELPGVSGVQLVSLIQAMRFSVRPYVLMLTHRTETSSLVAALERGADDYLRKPVEEAELISRVRAAARNYHVHAALVAKVSELEELLQQDSARAEVGSKATAARGIEPRALVLKAALDVLVRVGLPPQGSVSVTTPSHHDIIGWAGLAIPSMSVWLDIRVEADKPLLVKMAQKLVGETDGRGIDPHDLMMEIANLVRGHMGSQLQRYGHEPLSTVLPRCVAPEQLAPFTDHEKPKHYTITLDGGTIGLTVASSGCEVRKFELSQLTSGLVLSETLMSSSSPDQTLLRAGTLLTERVISRLFEFERREHEKFAVTTVAPSEFAQRVLCVPSLCTSGPAQR